MGRPSRYPARSPASAESFPTSRASCFPSTGAGSLASVSSSTSSTRASHLTGERDEELAVARVGEELRGVLEREPADLVDLVAGLGHAFAGIHHPVADDLEPALAVPVRGGGELSPQQAAQRRLLLDLA